LRCGGGAGVRAGAASDGVSGAASTAIAGTAAVEGSAGGVPRGSPPGPGAATARARAWRPRAPPSRSARRRARRCAALAAALGPPAAAAQPRSGAVERDYREGKQAYAEGDYETAAARFQDAYLLSDDPTYLFNLAQAQRLDGDCRGAHRSYREFLERMPDAPNRADVEAKIDALERCARPPPRLAPVPVLVPVETPSADSLALTRRAEAPAREPSRLGLKVALASALGMVLAIGAAAVEPDVGTGVALIAVPVGVGLMTGGVIRQVSDTRRAATAP
jgi:hypothetical protein